MLRRWLETGSAGLVNEVGDGDNNCVRVTGR